MQLSDKVTLCIGVGAQKAGTTWLGAYFAEHPSILMSPIKELHYFDSLWLPFKAGKPDRKYLKRLKQKLRQITIDDVRDNTASWRMIGALQDRVAMADGDHQKYLEFFAKRVGDRSVAAEISPSYSMLSVERFKEINALHPRIKIIFLLRNPVDRFWSALRYREQRKGVEIEEFFEDSFGDEGMVDRTDYQHTLEALKSAFSPENVFVEFYENLFAEETITRLCGFLDVPYHPAPLRKVVNQSISKPLTSDRRRRIGEAFRPVYEYCYEQFGERIPAPWQADLELLNRG